MAKRVSARRVKLHRQYTYEEAADLLGVTPQTVRTWRAQGLHVLTSQKPHLVMGAALREFLDKRADRALGPMAMGEFYCMACRARRRPYGMMADYVPISDTRGQLKALCETCEGPCIRFASTAQIASLAEILAIATRSNE
ncbi:helix-turn-helix domain-containing protein [Pseudohalocynthiibacter sp. F2068]|jgi:hypothetical protein|uniref:helix-turn-helix domain-containing protein n=1 Tax=Pseudohalocynthiibacter sp. F2068 TaxID=2926418 RepID=UPI001FF675EE|nr:helix-turn-helix domain-containing protein [Pseudohalocynthiibacter sp. F2068]MCK0104369.1 helix-turn-helix domain-containing protein [Pseudohalocynthiibacter sp. F2068]